MNRRSFLSRLAAVAALPLVPWKRKAEEPRLRGVPINYIYMDEQRSYSVTTDSTYTVNVIGPWSSVARHVQDHALMVKDFDQEQSERDHHTHVQAYIRAIS